MRTLVVLPTLNEAATVATVLRRVRSVMPDAHVLVVDDDSPDGTADVADAAGRETGGVEVIRRTGARGLGPAYREGLGVGLAHGYEVLVEMDADLSHDPSDLPRLVRPLRTEGADLVIGSRYVPGGSIRGWAAWRRLVSRAGNRYAAAMLRLPVTDSTSGYRAFRAAIVGRIDLDTVGADGYGFQVEMVHRVLRAGGRVVEVPIEFSDRTQGRSKMSSRIVVEALVLVTWWGVRDRVRDRLARRGASSRAR